MIGQTGFSQMERGNSIESGNGTGGAKKVNTYSKRRPINYTSIDNKNDNQKKLYDIGGLATTTGDIIATIPPETIVVPPRLDILAEISAHIKRLDVAQPALPIKKSRKSEIRPRLSIAPSQFEYKQLLESCNQIEEMKFSEWLDATKCDYERIEKIGESSFSEVLKMSSSKSKDGLAVKILPLLRPDTTVEPFSKSPEPIPVKDLLHEIKSLQALEGLRLEQRYAVPSGHTGFNRLLHCVLVVGPYPDELLNIWDAWKDENTPFNARPDFYTTDSLHVIVTMEFGGIDLDHYQLTSLEQAHAITCQILSSMALAEEKLQFEHRDLHLGNVLIRETHRSDIKFGNYMTIPTTGIICSIIDCSLARYTDCKGIVNYRDLEREKWLFTGDEEESRQYQIYRDMRNLVKDEDWEGYYSKTNLIWISFILSELLCKYQKCLKKEKALFEKLFNLASKMDTFNNCKEALKEALQITIN